MMLMKLMNEGYFFSIIFNEYKINGCYNLLEINANIGMLELRNRKKFELIADFLFGALPCVESQSIAVVHLSFIHARLAAYSMNIMII